VAEQVPYQEMVETLQRALQEQEALLAEKVSGAAILQSLTMVAGFGIRTFQYCLLNVPTQLT